MSTPSFDRLRILPAEGLDDPGQIADALLDAARSASLGVFVWDLAAERLVWNDPMYQLYGLPPGSPMQASAWLDILHPDDLEPVRTEVLAALAGERPYDTVFRARKGEGWCYVRATAWVERDAANRPVRMAGINQDISERYCFNLLVEQVQADTASQVGLAFLHGLVNALGRALQVSHVLIAEVFPVTAPTHARTLAVSHHGESADAMAFSLAGSPFEQAIREAQSSFLSGQALAAFGQHRLLQQCPAASCLTVPLIGADGLVLGLIAVLHDQPCSDPALMRNLIHLFAGRSAAELDRLRHEAEVARLNAELESRVVVRTEHVKRTLRELEAFTYAVSHDLNAPLRAVQGFGAILREDYAGSLDSTGRDYLERTLNAAERMGRLLDDLVNLSKISLRPLNVSKVDLSLLAAESIADLQDRHPRPGLTVQIDPHLIVHADPGLMRILLDCLLRNAWHRTASLADARIELSERSSQGRREFVVLDNSPGLDDGTAARLFSPFQDQPEPDQLAGSGTGLAIAQRVIHRHHGGIESENRPGVGIALVFWLPPASELMSLLVADDA